MAVSSGGLKTFPEAIQDVLTGRKRPPTTWYRLLRRGIEVIPRRSFLSGTPARLPTPWSPSRRYTLDEGCVCGRRRGPKAVSRRPGRPGGSGRTVTQESNFRSIHS